MGLVIEGCVTTVAITAATAQLIKKTLRQRQKKLTTLTKVMGLTCDSSIKLMVEGESECWVIKNTIGFQRYLNAAL